MSINYSTDQLQEYYIKVLGFTKEELKEKKKETLYSYLKQSDQLHDLDNYLKNAGYYYDCNRA